MVVQKKMLKEVKCETEHPLVYYEQGKTLISEEKWIEAKNAFLRYRVFIEAKDERCKKPEEDNFLYHLAYIQAQLNAQNLDVNASEAEQIASVLPDAYENEYRKQYKAWIIKYPRKKEDADPLKSINISRVSLGPS